jgi:cytochrome b
MSTPYGNETPPPIAPPPVLRPVAVWDIGVRLFHWGLVALFAVCSLTWQRADLSAHLTAGTLLLGLVLFRLGWGVWGSETARLAPLFSSPRAVAAHLRALRAGAPAHTAGHNPAGGLAVLLFLVLLLAEALSGVVVNNDIANESALTERMPPALANGLTFLHGALWYALLGLAALHLAAIGFYDLVRKERLVRAMITGKKVLPAADPAPALAPLWRAGATAAGAFLLAFLIAAWL